MNNSFTHAVHGMLPPVPKKPSTHWHVLEPTVLTVLTGQLEGVNMLEWIMNCAVTTPKTYSLQVVSSSTSLYLPASH